MRSRPTEAPEHHRDNGLTLIEVLVAMVIFGVFTSLALGIVISTSRASDDTRKLTTVGEETRLGMERLTREVRQASAVSAVALPQTSSDETRFTILIDFDGNSCIDPAAADPEKVTYIYDPNTDVLTMKADGHDAPLLATKVNQLSTRSPQQRVAVRHQQRRVHDLAGDRRVVDRGSQPLELQQRGAQQHRPGPPGHHHHRRDPSGQLHDGRRPAQSAAERGAKPMCESDFESESVSSRIPRVGRAWARSQQDADTGSALVITLLVMVVVGALATTITLVTTNNLQSATLARSAGVAVDAADAGVAEAMSYLRTNGTGRLCPATATGDPTSVSGFDLKTQTCVTNLNLTNLDPAESPGRSAVRRSDRDAGALRSALQSRDSLDYLVFSRGYGPNRASRLVAARVRVTGIGVAPIGYQGNAVKIDGQTYIDGQSIFARGCVYKRSALHLTGTDAFGLPAAVHSEANITEQQGDGPTCATPPANKAIHPPACNTVTSEYQYDQDNQGGTLPSGSPCIPSGKEQFYPHGSKLSPGDLATIYGIKYPPFSPEDIEQTSRLGDSAEQLQDRFDGVHPPRSPGKSRSLNLSEGTDVDLGSIHGFSDTASCTHRSLLVIVKDGDASWHASSTPLIGSVMLVTAGKQFDDNGTAVLGSVYADSIVIGGSFTVLPGAMACATNNPSPSLFKFEVVSYREIDS